MDSSYNATYAPTRAQNPNESITAHLWTKPRAEVVADGIQAVKAAVAPDALCMAGEADRVAARLTALYWKGQWKRIVERGLSVSIIRAVARGA